LSRVLEEEKPALVAPSPPPFDVLRDTEVVMT
jgi:hypothetical protein